MAGTGPVLNQTKPFPQLTESHSGSNQSLRTNWSDRSDRDSRSDRSDRSDSQGCGLSDRSAPHCTYIGYIARLSGHCARRARGTGAAASPAREGDKFKLFDLSHSLLFPSATPPLHVVFGLGRTHSLLKSSWRRFTFTVVTPHIRTPHCAHTGGTILDSRAAENIIFHTTGLRC